MSTKIIKYATHKKRLNITSKSWVTPWRSTRHKDQQLQQDQQHDAHFPTCIFLFDVAPHTRNQKSAEIPPELPSLYYTYYGRLSCYRGSGSEVKWGHVQENESVGFANMAKIYG